MSTKHTQGPWLVDEHSDTSVMADILKSSDDWVAVADTYDDGGHVAYCHPNNAPIIAAAPDLLQALSEAADFIDELVATGAVKSQYGKDLATRLDDVIKPLVD